MTSERCPQCKSAINKADEFCPHCGRILGADVQCDRHADREATGVCIICCQPYCKDCCSRTNGLFLCDHHSGYEIYQGMARVYGTSDPVQAEFAKSCLEKADLHPFIFSRKASPISLGGPDYMLFNASGEYDGHVVNEFKLMVPCQEVAEAEGTLHELELV